MKRNALLFITHKVDDKIIELFGQLKRETSEREGFDLFLVYNGNEGNCHKDVEKFNHDKVFYFNEDVVNECGFKMHYYYPYNQKFFGHNVEYSFLTFFRKNNNYDYYWIIEYDVLFNGNWNTFFDYFEDKDTDFITNYIGSVKNAMNKLKMWKEQFGKFLWLKTLNIPLENRYRSLNCIFRISNRAMKYVVDLYDKGNYGFYEIFMVTVLKNAGYSVKQMGSKKTWRTYDVDDLFVVGESQDNLINGKNPRTFAVRTSQILDPKNGPKNKLYHPIKGSFESERKKII